MTTNNPKKNLLILFFVSMSIFFVTLIWNKIYFPFHNISGATGITTINNYDPNNDTLRYIIFVVVPILVYFFLNLILKKEKLIHLNELFSNRNTTHKKTTKYLANNSFILILSLIFICLILFQFLSLDLPNFKLKVFHGLLHDGNYLTSAQNYLSNKSVWSSSFTAHGGSDVFYPVIAWKILGVQSIGAARLSFTILILFMKLLCIILSYQVTRISYLEGKTKILFFTIFSFLLISMSNYQVPTNYSYLSYRDIYIILFLIFFVELFIFSKIKLPSTIFIAFIPSVAILFHIDTGVYLNIILAIYVLYLFFIKKYSEIFTIFVVLTLSWLSILVLLGFDELIAFMEHVSAAALSFDYAQGLKYPDPFFSIGDNPHGARATRGLLLQISAGIFVIYNLTNKDSKFSQQERIFFIFLFLLSFIMYKNALGRSDAHHIRMSSDLPILINAFFVLHYILFKIEKNNYLHKFLSPDRNLLISTFVLITFFILTSQHILKIHNKFFKLKNIKNLKTNYINLINLDDDHFLDEKTIKLLNYYKDISKNEKCIENFTDDAVIPYLLKKPSCTKYYNIHLASAIKLQKNHIKKLIMTKPKYILYKSPQFKVDQLETSERLKIVNSYIISNYKLHKKFDGYEILKKK